MSRIIFHLSLVIFHHYRSSVNPLFVCILLDLIDLTPIHEGIDVNSLNWSHSHRGFSPVDIGPSSA
jgi:hypothetical protein